MLSLIVVIIIEMAFTSLLPLHFSLVSSMFLSILSKHNKSLGLLSFGARYLRIFFPFNFFHDPQINVFFDYVVKKSGKEIRIGNRTIHFCWCS
jgi:hypothetical protein